MPNETTSSDPTHPTDDRPAGPLPDDSSPESCPECSGRIVTTDDGEHVCDACGLVVDDQRLDHGPEWRQFDDGDDKSRVGSPLTPTQHDRGLSTDIGHDTDGYGNRLSGKTKQKMQRLREWNTRFQTTDSLERTLKRGLSEINRMASSLGLPDPARETAAVVYRRAVDEDLLRGHAIESIAAAAIVVGFRQHGVPRSFDELAAAARVDRQRIDRDYRHLSRELELAIEPADPCSYLPRYASELDLSQATEQTARELLEEAKAENVHSSKNPVGLAAAALYTAQLLSSTDEATQREISEVTDISEVTIRNRYQELADISDKPILTG